jgi:NADH:ubiquinone oxidoreductase subunit F (NADH-binding)
MTNGYQNQPTLLSNVETFAWVPAIVLRSAGQWYGDQGRKVGPWIPAGESAAIKGMRLFSISGDVRRPGVYEVPTGIPLGELIDDFAGGMADGKELVAVALSGPSGGLLPARIPVSQLNRRFVESSVPADVTTIDVREIPLDITVARTMGLMIGAGIVVYGTGADPVAEAIACSRFFRNESCGKCVPCRLGSQKITQIGERALRRDVTDQEWSDLRETAIQLGQVMSATSICGLGQVASNPVLSLLRFFPERLPDVATREDRGARP